MKFDDLTIRTITVHWLSGFDQSRFETWMSKGASIQATPDSLSFATYLVWPVEEADEGHVQIRRSGHGLFFQTDWFPGEDFDMKLFVSEDKGELLLMGGYERETFFVHVELKQP